jgi:hypothetical protein
LPIPVVFRVFPPLSCTNFKVSSLILRSLIHFELILVHDDRHVSSFSFLQADNHFSQQHLLKRLSFFYTTYDYQVSTTEDYTRNSAHRRWKETKTWEARRYKTAGEEDK